MKRYNHNLAAFSASRARAAGLRRAFTLVEVMVAIAIALALIVGISQIFAMAQKTTGGGTTLVKMNGTGRSIQSQLRQDFQSINIDSSTSPGLVITSYSAAAFRNKQDHDESRDTSVPPDPRAFNNPNTEGSNPTIPVALPLFPNAPFSTNYRIHRLDRLCMFERGTFHRQTADAPNLTSQTTTQEAFVWYGHLALLNDAGIANWKPQSPHMMTSGDPQTPLNSNEVFMNPGAPSLTTGPKNNNNEFAAQWALGRQAIALTSVDNNEAMYRPFAGGQIPLSILGGLQSTATDGTSSAAFSVPLFSSRYDLSLSGSQDIQKNYAKPLRPGAIPWFEQLSGLQCNLNAIDIIYDQRYFANVFPTKSPATFAAAQGLWLSASAAQTAPVFVRGCSQFIVEFAGDYVTQNQDSSSNQYGRVTDSKGDGTIDFIPIMDANRNWTRQIRWYGFPRDTMTYDSTTPTVPPTPGQDGQIYTDIGNPYITYDIIPLSMFLRAAGFGAVVPPFERNAGAFNTVPLKMQSSADFPFNNVGYANPKLPEVSAPYICAWDSSTGAASLPKLIRITIAIDDPNGRLNTEQTFEYIFELPN